MKISPNNRVLFEEIKRKHGLVKESILSNYFIEYLKQKLKRDKSLDKVLRDADLELLRMRKLLHDIESYGIEAPSHLKTYLGDKQNGR